MEPMHKFTKQHRINMNQRFLSRSFVFIVYSPSNGIGTLAFACHFVYSLILHNVFINLCYIIGLPLPIPHLHDFTIKRLETYTPFGVKFSCVKVITNVVVLVLSVGGRHADKYSDHGAERCHLQNSHYGGFQ